MHSFLPLLLRSFYLLFAGLLCCLIRIHSFTALSLARAFYLTCPYILPFSVFTPATSRFAYAYTTNTRFEAKIARQRRPHCCLPYRSLLHNRLYIFLKQTHPWHIGPQIQPHGYRFANTASHDSPPKIRQPRSVNQSSQSRSLPARSPPSLTSARGCPSLQEY